jgi:hypothetical protein
MKRRFPGERLPGSFFSVIVGLKENTFIFVIINVLTINIPLITEKPKTEKSRLIPKQF